MREEYFYIWFKLIFIDVGIFELCGEAGFIYVLIGIIVWFFLVSIVNMFLFFRGFKVRGNFVVFLVFLRGVIFFGICVFWLGERKSLKFLNDCVKIFIF